MEKKKLDKIISIVREEMMTANAPGASGGFGADSPAKGPRAGFSPVMGNVTLQLIGLQGYDYNCTIVYRMWNL